MIQVPAELWVRILDLNAEVAKMQCDATGTFQLEPVVRKATKLMSDIREAWLLEKITPAERVILRDYVGNRPQDRSD